MLQNSLDLYKKSLQSAWGFNDYNDWPIKFNTIMHLFIDDFAKEFLDDFELLQSRNISIEEIAQKFENPARVYRIINPIIFGMKRMKLDLKFQRQFVLSLLDIAAALKSGSVFNEDGRNMILSSLKIEKLKNDMNFNEADHKSSAMIHRFCGVMWAYTESIFFRAHDVTKEIHGPYKLDNERILLVREYLNLNPSEIWEGVPLLPFKKIAIYGIYKNSLNIKIDAYNHLFHEGGNYNEDLLSYRIEVEGKEIGLEEMMHYTEQMFETITKIHSWAEKADLHEKATKYAEIYWYRKKPLRDCLGRDWSLEKSVIEKINEGEIDERRVKNMTKEQIERLIYTII